MKYSIPLNIFLIFLISSCNNAQLFQYKGDYIRENIASFEYLESTYSHILSPDDKLSLSVWNHDDLAIGSAYSIYNTNESFGKWILIDQDSIATLPFIGKIKIAGLTIADAEKIITSKMSVTIKNPIVKLKVLNREVTVLGEVISPGNYQLEKESNSLIEVFGKSEGFNFYSNTKRIVIIRNGNACKIDLTQLSTFEKNNILIRNEDIIYVPSKKIKALQLNSPILIPFATALTSVGIIISLKN